MATAKRAQALSPMWRLRFEGGFGTTPSTGGVITRLFLVL